MPTIAITDQKAYSDKDFPLAGSRLELVVEFAADVPEAAWSPYLAQALRILANRAEAGKAALTELEEGERTPPARRRPLPRSGASRRICT